MKRLTREWVQKAEADWFAARSLSQASTSRRRTFHDQVGFHCQQAAEKYLKAFMQESGLIVLKTHNLVHLVDLILPLDPTLGVLRRGMNTLTRHAVEYRYPGMKSTKRLAQAALRHAEKVRAAIRERLALPA